MKKFSTIYMYCNVNKTDQSKVRQVISPDHNYHMHSIYF